MMSKVNAADDTKRPESVNTRQHQSHNISTTHLCLAFFCFLIAHSLSAIYTPIQDCDEVFNFWEPTHYLNHGYGKQTWEFSPVYAIRSWLYASLHAISIMPVQVFASYLSKSMEFYFLRLVLGSVCAASETLLYRRIAENMNPRIAILYLLVLVTSAGNFHAATAYLPSSFAMYSMTLAMAAFMVIPIGSQLARGLAWLAAGTILGWPFIAVLCIPFVLECLIQLINGGMSFYLFGSRLFDGALRSLSILALEVLVDSLFYKKFTCVPLNIIWYNVLSGSDKGPEIYGTEPWHFYIRNLIINFNIWFILAISSMPLILLHQLLKKRAVTRYGFFRSLILVSPLYLWFAILTAQPHKEERFMYPVYPCIALNAALSLHTLMLLVASPSKSVKGGFVTWLKISVFALMIFVAAILGILRSVGLATAYSAPLSVYQDLPDMQPHETGTNKSILCLGKEWYRFPSSYNLPNNLRLEFITSEFRGLLPGSFPEESVQSHAIDLFPGTAMIPEGMNDLNIEDSGKYTSLSRCDWLVDLQLEDAVETRREPDFISDSLPLDYPAPLACGTALEDMDEELQAELNERSLKGFTRIRCERFLDAAETSTLGRLFYIPDWKWIPPSLRRKWGRYCLLRYQAWDDIDEELKKQEPVVLMKAKES